MKNFILKIWNTPPIHTIAMTVLGSIIGALEPFVNAWLQGEPNPSLHVIAVTAIKAGAAALVGYLIKNGIFGSSGTSTYIPPPPLTPKS